jgi:hypothetical protein
MDLELQHAVQFPTGIDDDVFNRLGAFCADGIAIDNRRIVDTCYDGVRPVGIIAYFAIPKLVGANPVTQSYALLALNFAMFILCVFALRTICFPFKSGYEDRTARFAALIASVVAVTFVLLSTIVSRMADLPATAFFLLGISMSVRALTRELPNRGILFFGAGLAMAVASLLKPNYYVYGPLVLGMALSIDLRERLDSKWTLLGLLKHPVLVGLGLSFALIQCVWIYKHTGVFWPYDAEHFAKLKTPHLWPFIGFESVNIDQILAAGSTQFASVITLATQVDELSHALIKLFLGIFPQRWEPYSVFEHVYPPPRWHPSTLELNCMLLASGAYLSFTAWAATFGPKSLRILNATGLFYAVFTMAISHTEFRYYMVPRLILFTTLIFYITYFLTDYFERKPDWLKATKANRVKLLERV